MSNPTAAIQDVDGFLDLPEAALLYETAANAHGGCIVEIGNYRGRSTIMLALGARESGCEVYSIDPHDNAWDGTGAGAEYGVIDRAPFLRNLLDAGVADIVKPVTLPSSVVAPGWVAPIAFLWVDGSHVYADVKRDLDAWTPHIVPGGYLACHDNWFAGVSHAVNEFLAVGGFEVVTKVNATTLFRKRGEASAVRPDVSVLIPAYNARETLPKAINNALDQPGLTVEVVICDDASTDDTTAFLDSLTDNRVKVVTHAANQGLAAALNSAAAVASGRYFIECDSDDWLEPGCLKPLVDALEHAPEEIGFAYGTTQYHGLSAYRHTPRAYQRGVFYFGFASLYAFLYKRAAWDAGCRYRTTCTIAGRVVTIQDWDMALQLTEYMRYDGAALPEVLVLNYNHRHGSLTDFTNEHNEEVVTAFRQRWPRVQVQQL